MPLTPRPFTLLASMAALACTLFTTTDSALAGAWTQARGEGYAKLWTRTLVGQQAYFADGEVRELPDRFTDLTLNAYGELGLTDRWTLVGICSACLGHADAGVGERTLYTDGFEVGIRRGLLSGAFPVAIELHYGASPGTGARRLTQGEVQGEAFEYIPTLQTQKLSGELQLGMGASWGWASANLGGRWYSHEGLDPVLFGLAQVGTTTKSGFVFEGHLLLHEPLGEIAVTNITGVGQTRYLGLGFSASWWISDHLGLNLGFDGVIYAASNAATPSILLGIEIK